MGQSGDIPTSMWSVFWVLFVSAFVPSQGAVTVQKHKLGGNDLAGAKDSKPLVLPGAGAALSTINKERQVYAQDFPHTMKWALSPVLLPPASASEEADQHYYPYYYNTEENADQHYYPYYYNTEENADQYYYPYYYNTEENADLFYQNWLRRTDPWAAYYQGLPSLAPSEQLQGPSEELPQHTGLYEGPINTEENIIPDTPRIFLKSFN